MSVINCRFSPKDDCYNNQVFRKDLEPAGKHGYENLNPKVMSDVYASDFAPVNKDKTLYGSTDPRLISAFHNGQRLLLDRPPCDDSIKLADIYTDPQLKNYGKNYNTYTDIKAGQIMYYIDKSIEDPFFTPNFATTARAIGSIYKDPMSAIKPNYDRIPIKCRNPVITKGANYTGGSSFMEDTDFQREDILALQMRRMNRERWEPRWT